MSLAEKIAQASQSIGTLEPDKRNDFQKYDYLSANKILTVAGSALAKHGISLIPAITEEESWYVEYGNKSRWDSRVMFYMTVTDGDEELGAHWTGRGSDSAVPDKAMYKAITSGHKYFLMKLLNIGEGNEDGEHENVDVQGAQRVRKKQHAPDPQEYDADLFDPGLPTGQLPDVQDPAMAQAVPAGWELVSEEMVSRNMGPFLDFMREKHTGSGRKCTEKQYGFVTGLVDGCTEKQHGIVLSVLAGEPVSGETLIGSELCRTLIDTLSTKSKTYDPDKAAKMQHNLKSISGAAEELGVAQ